MSLKIIDKNIRTITTNANKLNILIHETAMLVANHAKEHGDCTRALTLVKAMPASMRRTMLVMWFDTFTPIRVVLVNDKVGIAKENTKLFKPWDLELGNETPFYTLAEQNPEGKEMDFDKIVALIAGLAKRIEKQADDGKVKEDDIASAKAIAAQLSAMKFARVTADNDQERNDANIGFDAPKLNVVNG
jgi:hypothetical protein